MSRATPNNAGQTKMLPPPVTMMTRKKSAQSQRQLRNIDRSMTKITQLLMRSPPKTAKKTESSDSVKAKAKASPVKSPKKAEQRKPLPKSPVVKNAVATLTASEYYPDKMKRKIKVERVTLKSKYKLTKVDGLNKRKRTTPMTTKVYTIPLEETCPKMDAAMIRRIPEPSMDELMKEDSLDDEDLMEILTCPSPVWWEDPPDKSYDEDPILQTPSLSEKLSDSTTLSENTKSDSIISELNTLKHNLYDKNVASMAKPNDKFTRKRTALENLLMNIKTKKIDENLDCKLKCGLNHRIDERDNDKIHQIDSRSESSASEDLFVGKYEDVLNDLENIDMPIAAAVEKKVKKESEDPNRVETDNSQEKKLKADDLKLTASGVEDKFEMILQEGAGQVNLKKIKRKGQKSLKNLQNSSPKTLIWTSNTGDKKIINLIDDSKERIGKEVKTFQSNDLNVPKQMPPLKKCTKIKEENVSSPPHASKFENTEDDAPLESFSSESDTISDTNIKFLDDPEMSTDDSDRSKTVENKPTEVKTVRKRKDNLRDVKAVTKTCQEMNDDCLVVYKIIDGVDVKNSSKHDKLNDHTPNKETDTVDNEIREIASQNSNSNDFYKKCKAFNRKKDPNKTKTDIKNSKNPVIVIDESNNGNKKNIALSNDEVMNYCLNCSSIFDTDECKYCKDKNDDVNSKRAKICKEK